MPTLQPHQQRVVDRLYAENAPHGLIAYHSLGSGKTLTALAAMQQALKNNPGKRGLFVAPASLVENVNKEIVKHKLDDLTGNVDIMSYEKATNRAEELAKANYALSVFDEAHRLRNTETKRVASMKNVINNSGKVLMLTGTAGYNHPSDITGLINLINPRESLPNKHSTFEKEYIDNKTWKLRNKDKLGKTLKQYVDKYDTPTDSKDFPTVERFLYHVPMQGKQVSIYNTVSRDIPREIRMSLRNNLPISLQDANKLNFFSTGVRQVSNTPSHHDTRLDANYSPKLRFAAYNMAQQAKNVPGFRGVTYSNFLDAGLDPYKTLIEKHGIKPLVFTGKLSPSDKKAIVDEYNSDDKDPRVLLVSSSGGEGLDLKRTRVMQILEPHFNKSKIRQVEGRASRYKSHEDLPENERKVRIEEYRSVLPKTTWQRFWEQPADTAIDDYLANLSNKKQSIVDEINGLVENK